MKGRPLCLRILLKYLPKAQDPVERFLLSPSNHTPCDVWNLDALMLQQYIDLDYMSVVCKSPTYQCPTSEDLRQTTE